MQLFNEEFLSTKGRINRKVFNLYILFVILLAIVVLVPCSIISSSVAEDTSFFVLLIGQGIVEAALLPGLFLAVRRLHDLNRSGTYVLWSVAPILNFFWLIYLMFAKGTNGLNKYGQNPLQANIPDELEEDKTLISDDKQLTLFEKKYFSTEERLGRKPLIKYIAVLIGAVLVFICLIFTVEFISQLVQYYFGFEIFSSQPLIASNIPEILTFGILCLLALLMVAISVPVDFLFIRRLHDLNFSGWWLLLTKVIPFAIVPFVIVLMLVKGKDDTNKYGASPLKQSESEVTALDDDSKVH